MNNPYLWIALAGLLLKVFAGYRLHTHWHKAPEVLVACAFLVLIYLQTFLELYGFYLLENPDSQIVLWVMKFYYALFSATLLTVPLVISSVAKGRVDYLLAYIVGAIVLTFAVLILATDYIVAGIKPLTQAYTAIKGPYYWIFQAFSITAMVMTLVTSHKGYRHGSDELRRVKSLNLFLGFCPYTLALVTIIVLMSFGIQLNAAGISSFFLAVFSLVVSINIKRSEALDFRVYIPWSEKARQIRELTKPLRNISLEPETAKGLLKQYDDTLIDIANDIFDKQKDKASWLGVSESKMSRMLSARNRK